MIAHETSSSAAQGERHLLPSFDVQYIKHYSNSLHYSCCCYERTHFSSVFIWTAVSRAAANASIIGGPSLGVIETDDDADRSGAGIHEPTRVRALDQHAVFRPRLIELELVKAEPLASDEIEYRVTEAGRRPSATVGDRSEASHRHIVGASLSAPCGRPASGCRPWSRPALPLQGFSRPPAFGCRFRTATRLDRHRRGPRSSAVVWASNIGDCPSVVQTEDN